MGSGVSTKQNDNSLQLIDNSLIKTFNKLQEADLNDKEIYQNLKEIYGSIRVNKRLNITENTIRGLAIQKLLITLENNKINYPTIKNETIDEKEQQKYSQKDSKKEHPKNESNDVKSKINQDQQVTPNKNIRKKPNLNIVIHHIDDNNNNNENEDIVHGPSSNGQKTPRGRARLSPSGAVRVGNLAINEKGLQKSGYFQENQAIGFLTAGRSDFVIIGSLGRGASGSVLEALHIPTLTIVALKLLPVYDSENLHNIASELDVLYRNLAELKLIDEILEDHDPSSMLTPTSVHSRASDSSHGSISVKSICPQVLAMYDGNFRELYYSILFYFFFVEHFISNYY